MPQAKTTPQCRSGSPLDRLRRRILLLVLLVCSMSGFAQEEAATSAPKARTTGLPEAIAWTFNFDAGAGAFGFNNSLYANQRPDPSGDLSDNWLESYIKPAIGGEWFRSGSTVFAKLSGVGARTFSAPPTLVGEDASSFQVEDLYIGWRSGDAIKAGADALELTFGRAPYKIGHGFLLWDGAGDGGTRGGFWSGPRKAWEYAGIGRFKAANHTLEAFYLDRDELPENDTGSTLWGINYELAAGEGSTFGLTYLNTHSTLEPLRNGMDVYDARVFASPAWMQGFSVELEYALEDNGDALDSTGWTGQVGYEMQNISWSPRISYRYTLFEGDDPNTASSEAFDSLFPGFYDWGTWWQGEIGGEYFLSNSNLISQQVRLHLTPSETVGGGLIFFDFRLDQPQTFAANVTSQDLAYELDGYVDWKLNDNFTTSIVLAYADPREAMEQGFGRTEALSYGMVYLSYSY